MEHRLELLAAALWDMPVKHACLYGEVSNMPKTTKIGMCGAEAGKSPAKCQPHIVKSPLFLSLTVCHHDLGAIVDLAEDAAALVVHVAP